MKELTDSRMRQRNRPIDSGKIKRPLNSEVMQDALLYAPVPAQTRLTRNDSLVMKRNFRTKGSLRESDDIKFKVN